MKLLNIGYVSNETNKDVHMYIEEFILVDIWIHWSWISNWICIGNAVIYIQRNNGREMWELLLGANWQKRTERITMKWEPVNLWANVWIVIPLFALRLTPVSVNGNHHWL